MQKQRIKPEIIEKLRIREDIVVELSRINHMRISTIQRWIRHNQPYLTFFTSLKLIRDMLKLECELPDMLEWYEDDGTPIPEDPQLRLVSDTNQIKS